MYNFFIKKTLKQHPKCIKKKQNVNKQIKKYKKITNLCKMLTTI